MDIIAALPLEVTLEYLIPHLTASDIVSALAVSRLWQHVLSIDSVWKCLFKSHFRVFPPRWPSSLRNKTWKQRLHQMTQEEDTQIGDFFYYRRGGCFHDLSKTASPDMAMVGVLYEKEGKIELLEVKMDGTGRSVIYQTPGNWIETKCGKVDDQVPIQWIVSYSDGSKDVVQSEREKKEAVVTSYTSAGSQVAKQHFKNGTLLHKTEYPVDPQTTSRTTTIACS
jgi:hypothetical protein